VYGQACCKTFRHLLNAEPLESSSRRERRREQDESSLETVDGRLSVWYIGRWRKEEKMVVHRQKKLRGDNPSSQGLGSGRAFCRERADCPLQKVDRGAVPGIGRFGIG
jgi:hypothetical protein